MQQLQKAFAYVEETFDSFLSLWPHRYDYLWADHPHLGEKPAWRTESRHPLSDRVIDQGAYLFGVRFGKETKYCLIDIDRASPYHPANHPEHYRRIIEALEPLELVTSLCCTSSDSNGLHIYFPFKTSVTSWKLAAAVTSLLENAGFKIAGGTLEVFPNKRNFSGSAFPGHFNGHRLPMQGGSFLLNNGLEPMWSTRDSFLQQWQLAAEKNILSHITLDKILKRIRRQRHQLSQKADKFLNDLNAEIEKGWTGSGQTNRLLGRITMRSFIFGHVLYANEPLEGSALVEDIVNVAKSLPGYRDFCNHQHEIKQRAQEWAACIESSRYFHFGKDQAVNKKSTTEATEKEYSSSSNQKREKDARARISNAVASLKETNSLPNEITRRFKELIKFNISGTTLYKHRDLWHPELNSKETWEKYDCSTIPTASEELHQRESTEANSNTYTSLLGENACNTLQNKALGSSTQESIRQQACNTSLEELLNTQGAKKMTPYEGSNFIAQLILHIRQRAQKPWLWPPD